MIIKEPEIKEKETKEKVRFASDVHVGKPVEESMMCIIDGETFFFLEKRRWIGDWGASCHITNNDTGLYNVTDINESVQGSSGSMFIIKKANCS